MNKDDRERSEFSIIFPVYKEYNQYLVCNLFNELINIAPSIIGRFLGRL